MTIGSRSLMGASIRRRAALAMERSRRRTGRDARDARAGTYNHSVDTVAALLIVVFQFFFGWCGENPGRAPPAEPPASASIL